MAGLYGQQANPMKSHYRLKTRTSLLVLAVLLSGCAAQQAFKRGHQAEIARDYETAMTQFRIAAEAKPQNVDYQLKYEQARFAAAFSHFESGRRALEKKDLETAKGE